MVRIKICGMQSQADIAICLRAGADALGFIFAESPRCLDLERAAVLAQLVPPFVSKVGVFADNSPAFVRAAIEHCQLDVLQFSGAEDDAFCGSFGKPTIKVVRPDSSSRLLTRDGLHVARAIALMIDSRSGTKNGGTGIQVAHDVATRARTQSPLPFILAGGLTAANVAQAVATVRPWAVDVRSGVERSGRKDAVLVRQFIAAARERNE